jgi:cytoskeletal protein CcmA (bactofilin family)
MALLRKDEVVAAAEPVRAEMGALLGRGSRFEGKLSFEGTVRIDGEFVGDIVADGQLLVGEGAVVEGTVRVATAIISGTVNGTVSTTGALELKRSARVTGELAVESLTVERGAFFEGSVKMGDQAGRSTRT